MMGKSPLAKALVGKQVNLPPALKAKIKASPEPGSSPAKIIPLLAGKAAALIGKKLLAKGVAKAGAKAAAKAGTKAATKKASGKLMEKAGKKLIDNKDNIRSKMKSRMQGKGEEEKKAPAANISSSNPYASQNTVLQMKGKKPSPAKKEEDPSPKSNRRSYVYGSSDNYKPNFKVSKSNPFGNQNRVPEQTATQKAKDAAANTKSNKESDTPPMKPIERSIQKGGSEIIDRGVRKLRIKKSTKAGSKFDKLTGKGKNPLSSSGKKLTREQYISEIMGGSSKPSSASESSKKTTGDNFLNNLKSTSKPPKIKGAGKEAIEGVSLGTSTSKQKTNKKVLSTKVVKKEPKLLETKSFDVDKALKSKGKDIKKSNKVIQKGLNKSEKERVKKGNKEIKGVKKEIKGVRKERKKATKQFEKSTDKSKKGGLSNLKKNNVPSSVAKVPVAKRPALYDDGYKDESTRSKSTVKREVKKVKKNTSRGERGSTTLTAESIKAGKPVTVKERLKELRKEKRNSPANMMKKSPNKMMKKAPSKMMKKAPAKMMKKAPAKMMKKKK